MSRGSAGDGTDVRSGLAAIAFERDTIGPIMSLKLTKPQGQLLFILIMCLTMSGCMSLAMTFVRLGFTAGLIENWLKNWAIGFVVAIPIALLIVPPLRRFVDAITRA